MCQHEVLSQNKNGYVIRCKQCSNYQIGFGTSVITYSPEQFEILQEEIFLQKKQNEFIKDKYQKSIIIPSFSRSVQFVVNYKELSRLIDLLEEASCMLKFKEMLNPDIFSNH